MLTFEQIEAYFDRINLDHATRSTLRHGTKDHTALEPLTILLKNQMSAIPWDNLMLHYTSEVKPPSLDIEDMFDQIVTRRRGHICHATNRLLAELLRSLGFSVYCTAMRRNEPVGGLLRLEPVDRSLVKFGPWEHSILIVELGADKYAVSASASEFSSPVPNQLVHDKPFVDVGTRMQRMLHSAIPGNTSKQKWWRMQIRNSINQSWMDIFCFQEVEWMDLDFILLSRGLWAHGTAWLASLVVCIRYVLDQGVPVGWIMICGNELRHWMDGKNEVIEKFYCESERISALKEHFGIVLSEEEECGIVGRISELGEDDFDYYQ